MQNKRKSDPANISLGNCEYFCNGENKAVSEVWYKPICNPCFRKLMDETAAEIKEAVNRAKQQKDD